MFNLGDLVFRATYGRHEKWVTCPDCLGTRHVKVILGDGTEVTIECGGCYPGGFEASKGVILQYEYRVEVRTHTVTGVTVRSGGAEYELDKFGGCSFYVATDKDVFATEAEALAYGESMRAEHEEAENKRLMSKTKDHKSWAWNATYHRREIARHEREIAYHKQKAHICASKAKNTE